MLGTSRMVNRPTPHFLGGPSRSSSSLRALGLAALLAGLVACGSLESEEAREVAQDAKVVAKEASKEVVAASKEVAQATREVAQATKEQLDKVDPEDVERAIDGVAGAMGAPKGEPGSGGANPLADAAQAIKCEEPGVRCTVTADFADRARQNGRMVAEQLRIEPARGDVKGVRIEAIDAGSVASLLGLKVGDVITHINGTPIGSMQDAVMLYMSIRAARSFTIDYQRSGEDRTLQLDVV
jgi:C-terminal processing protease CtpA/Prc